MPWLRYWIVLAFALVMELLLEKIDGVYFTLFKLIFVLWCISPVYYNGSQVVFTHVLLPLHGIVQYVCIACADIATEIGTLCMDILVSPLLQTVAEMFEYSKYFLEELKKVTLDIPTFIMKLSENVKDIIVAVPQKGLEFLFCELIQNFIPTFVYQCCSFVEAIVEKMKQTFKPSEPKPKGISSGTVDAVFGFVKKTVLNQNNETKKERLFSNVIRQVIHKKSTIQEEPRLFSKVFKEFMYG